MENLNIVQEFLLQNPWREGKQVKLPDNFIPRDIVSKVFDWMDEPDILVILGPRQSGKTTALKKIILNLSASTPPENIFYFNLDSGPIRELFSEAASFVRFIKDYQKEEGRVFVIADEVQRIENAGLFLKNLYDAQLDFKMIVSGSSSLEIKARIKEHLTGRKKLFHLLPLSFAEFIRRESLPSSLFDSDKLGEEQDRLYGQHLKSCLEEFAIFGGYPKVVLQKNPDKKIEELKEIYSSYIQKDVVDFLKVERSDVFNKLVALLAYQTGNLVKKEELSTSLASSWTTVGKYLQILTDTFVVNLLLPYFTNRRKEITQMPKVYFTDTGLRNYVCSSFSNLEMRPDKGAIIETVVLSELAKRLKEPQEIRFWRTQTKAEVDFVILKNRMPIPVEVKFSRLKKPAVTRSFRSFIDSYQPKQAIVLNSNLLAKARIKDTEVLFLPVHWFIFYPDRFLRDEIEIE